jgi:endoplasmic reticulum junction formation protein lunapark
MAEDGWGWLISVYRIYGVRTASAGLFDHRISATQQQLETLNKQRQETIEKLKIATKYNSTQQLLEKYGAESPKSAPKNGKAAQKKETGSKTRGAQTGSRTGFVPPPTANIQRPPAEPLPSTPRRSPQSMGSSPQSPTFTGHNSTSPLSFIEEPGFAPNAFPTPPQYIEQPRWYDRLLDVLMGEDETLPKNRLALICGNCRLVNGQAPPGTKDLETLGRWRCGACGAWNGVESKTKKALADIDGPPSPSNDGVREPVSKRNDEASSAGDATDDVVIIAASEDDNPEPRGSEEGDQSELFESEPQPPPKPKRGRPKKSKKKA